MAWRKIILHERRYIATNTQQTMDSRNHYKHWDVDENLDGKMLKFTLTSSPKAPQV